MHPTLTKSFLAQAAIGANLFVAAHADRRKVTQAAASSAKLFGVSDLAADAAGMVDVHVDGTAIIRAGGTIAAGDYLTSDAQGRAIVATPVVGTAVRVGAMALEPAVLDDLFEVKVITLHIPAA